MEKTAIENLELKLLGIISFDSEELRKKYKDAINEANKIFEQQVMDAFEIGDLVGRAAAARVFEPNDKIVMLYPEITSEQYYNETFKSEKHNTDIRSMDKLIESNKKFDENNLKGFKYDPNDRSEDTPDITNFFY